MWFSNMLLLEFMTRTLFFATLEYKKLFFLFSYRLTTMQSRWFSMSTTYHHTNFTDSEGWSAWHEFGSNWAPPHQQTRHSTGRKFPNSSHAELPRPGLIWNIFGCCHESCVSLLSFYFFFVCHLCETFYYSSGFETDPRTSKFEIEATVPRISLVGKYKINGKVLVLPIQGRGKSNLTLGNDTFTTCVFVIFIYITLVLSDDVSLRVKFKPKIIEKNGKTYIQTEKFKLNFDTTR